MSKVTDLLLDTLRHAEANDETGADADLRDLAERHREACCDLLTPRQRAAASSGVEALLSDFRHEASLAYGIFNPERNYSGRALFVIDKQGRLAYKDVSGDTGDPSQVPEHLRALEAIEALA